MTGDKNYDGTPRPPRFGLMTIVAKKQGGNWQIEVAQNTNSLLGTPPELKGIKTPIPYPGIGNYCTVDISAIIGALGH
jgi:hypothetical protein